MKTTSAGRTLMVTFALVAGCSETKIIPAQDTPVATRDGGEAGRQPPTFADAGAADSGVHDAGEGAKRDAGTITAEVPTCATDLSAHLGPLGVPGLSAGIVKNGRLVCTAVAGHANYTAQTPVVPDTGFLWASVSKTVVATAIMTLVESGALRLDDRVNQHLPFNVSNPECTGEAITIRQLLTHVSSIIDEEDTYGASYSMGDSPVPLGEFMREYLVAGGRYYDADGNFDYECPGEYTEYSNIAVALGAYIVEVASGEDFDAFCRARIFGPLGMSNTSMRIANLDLTRVADSHVPEGGGFRSIGQPGWPTYPDGGLRSSVPELARFLLMIMQGGMLDGVRIVSQASVDEMLSIQDAQMDDVQGLVWFYQAFPGRPSVVGHDGSDDGAASYMFFDPTDDAGVLLVANADWWWNSDDSPAADALFGALFAESEQY
ncbi:MAG: serine hydrolase domain-containing protein [Deltaproteobacteria bacterium]